MDVPAEGESRPCYTPDQTAWLCKVQRVDIRRTTCVAGHIAEWTQHI